MSELMQSSIISGGMDDVCICLMNILSVFHQCVGLFMTFRNLSDNLSV